MYNQNYEEYMRNVLGYMPSYQDMEYTYRNDPGSYYAMPENYDNPGEMDTMYPDIYRMIYPMVKKVCMNHQGEITKEAIDKMTLEIFVNMEGNDSVDAKLTVQHRGVENKTGGRQEENRNRREDRSHNSILKDLIKILILRELQQGNRPPIGGRPPFPRPNSRPPFPGGPGPMRTYGETFYA